MKNFEFNNWVEYTRSIYPDFRADSEGLRDVWQQVLANATLAEAKAAVSQYAATSKTGFAPKGGQIAEIIKLNRQNQSPAYQPPGELVEDMPERRFHEDIALGRCRHNLYCYRDAAVLVKSGEAVDFDEGLRLSCRKRTAARGEQPRDFEFPSDEDLQAAGLKGVKAKSGDCKRILESFIRQWSMPR